MNKVHVLAQVPFEKGAVQIKGDLEGTVTGLNFTLLPAEDVSLLQVSAEGWVSSIKEPAREMAAQLAWELVSYFRGEKVRWSLEPDLTMEPAFTRAVFERAMRIPHGQTATYGQIASDVGSPGGARAVGQAMSRNRFPLVIPCHRVVAGSGKIGGFSSGVDLKRFLLALEGNFQ